MAQAMTNYEQLIDETRAAVAAAIQKGTADGTLRKALDVSSGLKGYTLEAPAKQLVPLMSPFNQSIPRSVKDGAEAVNWKVINRLSMPQVFSTERGAGSTFTTSVAPKTAAFKFLRVGGQVTRAAVAASKGFDQALAKETTNTLLLAKKLEEICLLGAISDGNDLAAPSNIVVADRAGKGSINGGAGTTYYFNVLALDLQAANRIALDRPANYDGTDALLTPRASFAAGDLNPVGGSVEGCGVSALGTEANSGSLSSTGHGIKLTWTPVPNAAAYAVFGGTATGAANQKLQCIISQTSVTLTSLLTSASAIAGNAAEVPSAGTYSGDPNGFDGIIPQLLASGSGAQVKYLNDVLKGSSSDGEITALQDLFSNIYDVGKIGRFRVVVGGQEARAMTKLGVTSNSLQIFATPGPEGRVQLTQGAHIGQVVNATTGDICPVETAPWLVGGTVLVLPLEIPYNDANLSAPVDVVCGYDWERWDYGTTRSTGQIYDFDVSAWEVVRVLFGAGCGVLCNVFKG